MTAPESTFLLALAGTGITISRSVIVIHVLMLNGEWVSWGRARPRVT